MEAPDRPGTHLLYTVRCYAIVNLPFNYIILEIVIMLSLFQMVVVWDVSHAVRGGEMSIIAKAHTDVDICRMRIAKFDDSRYCKLIIENNQLFLHLTITLSFSVDMSSIEGT